ncbi:MULTISPECIES: TrbC/VirB2 family protein [Bartonella]|uniref:Conjugal transfer protein TrbC n=2 Tax=Bartonella schoenbuchensis TaxID=165694 RepID=E6Z169_BARSR
MQLSPIYFKNNPYNQITILFTLGIVFLLFFILGDSAYAAGAPVGLPWETPLKRIMRLISGPIAFGISLVAILIGGIVLVFGGEINRLVKWAVRVVFVVSVVVFINALFAGALL